MKLFRSISESVREDMDYNTRWNSEDKGLILCWEKGRQMANKKPQVAQQALNNELPVLGWKGGVGRTLVKKEKYGTLHYLAQWQGLRGEDLNIDFEKEVVKVCSKTGMKITYTFDSKKYMLV